jgi:hypothetical protein
MVYTRDIWPIGHPKILYRPKRRRVWRYQRSNQNPSRHICYVQQTNIILLRYDIWPICSRDTLPGHLIPFQICMESSMFVFYPFVLYFIFPSSRVCIYNEYRIAWCLLFISFKRGQNPNAHIILARSNIRFIRRFMDS